MLRRNFLASTTAAAAGALTFGGRALFAQTAPAAPAVVTGRKIKIGLVGCGHRGVWMGNFFKQHGGFEITAVTDYFPEKAKRAAKKLGVPESHCFSGLSGYKRLLDTKPDAVAIIAVPYFYPQMSADAIAAGAHVFMAKPIAVDVPGCFTVAATGKLATEKKRVMLIDFQTRSTDFYIEAMKRVHEGAIGSPILGEGICHYDGGDLRRKPATDEERLRGWGACVAYCGDIITEQEIHTLDVINWAFNNVPPLHAFGSCGRKTRRLSECHDSFTLHFQYPNATGVTFSGRQFNGHGSLPEAIWFRLFGTKGTLETSYGGNVMIRGDVKTFYRGGKTGNIYEAGAVANVANFYKAITAEDYSNPTVAPSVQANLMTILGRTAAYTGKLVTWDEVLRDTNRLEAKLAGLKD